MTPGFKIFPDSWLKAFNNLDLKLVLILLWSLNYLSTRFIGNEENYLQWSRQYYNPEWIPHSFTLVDFPLPRLVFMSIAGWMIETFGFIIAANLGRLIIILLMAYPVASILRRFQLSNVQWLIILQLGILSNQSFFGGAWIWLAFEPKVLAYTLTFWALHFALDKKYIWVGILMALAVWCHILVGFWMSILLFFTFVLRAEEWRDRIIPIVLFGLITLPYVYWVQVGLAADPADPTGVDPDWIYTYFRNPHHVGLFKSWAYFSQKHLKGLILSALMFSFIIYYGKEFVIQPFERLWRLAILAFIIAFLFLLVAIFDKQGAIIKYYPFRTLVMANLFGFSLLAYKLFPVVKAMKWGRAIRDILLVCALISALKTFTDQFISLNGKVPSEKRPAYRELVAYIKQNTAPEDVFVFVVGERVDRFEFTNFSRLTDRERFASFKFIPSTPGRIQEWYERLQWRGKLYNDMGQMDSMDKKYSVDYIITKEERSESNLTSVFKNHQYYLYKKS